MATSMTVISLGTTLGSLSGNTKTKTKYSGTYTTIYKSSLLFGFTFSAVLLGQLSMSQ